MRICLALAVACQTLATTPSWAELPVNPEISVHHGRVVQTAKAGQPTQGFVEIDNPQNLPDTLTGADCPIAGTTLLVGPDGAPIGQLPVTAGAQLRLTPKGPHLLLQSTHFTIDHGGAIPCSLTFLNAGEILVYLYAVPAP